MSAPPRSGPGRMSRQEEMTVSGAALSGAPLGGAAVTGGVVALGDLGLHLLNGSIGLGAVGGSVSLGVSVFFLVAAAAALFRARAGRAARWARGNPWQYALVPGVAVAIIAFVLTTVLGGGVLGGIWAGAWHGAAVYGLTGVAGVVAGRRRRRPTA